MILVVAVIFFTPNDALLNRLNAHAFEAVVVFLGSGIFFMILKRPKVMFTCMGLCTILCLYLKSKSNSGIHTIFNRSDNDFVICQAMINSGSDQYVEFTQSLQTSQADIINIQEVTPDWSVVLKDALGSQYPYHTDLNRIDPYGMVIYSKFPIRDIDTLMFRDTLHPNPIPALKLELNVKEHVISFVGCHVLPRMNNKDFDKVQGFLDSLAAWASGSRHRATMIAGDLGVTPWDYVLQKFISDSKLNLSRREPHLFVQPFEHILYSNEIVCNRLSEVLTADRNHIGIQGYYSFNKKK
jgi:hypothetical protein